MTDDDRERRMKELEERLGAYHKAATPGPRKDEPHSQAQLAWRMVTELVAGLLIGFGIGYGLDRLSGTMPLFLVLFTLLGLAAGIKTMLRSAGELQRRHPVDPAGDDQAARRGSDENAARRADDERNGNGD